MQRKFYLGQLPLQKIEEPDYVKRKLELLRVRLEDDGVPAVPQFASAVLIPFGAGKKCLLCFKLKHVTWAYVLLLAFLNYLTGTTWARTTRVGMG